MSQPDMNDLDLAMYACYSYSVEATYDDHMIDFTVVYSRVCVPIRYSTVQFW